MYSVIEPLGSILMRSCVFLYLFYNSTPEYEDDSWGVHTICSKNLAHQARLLLVAGGMRGGGGGGSGGALAD